jgi:SSS family solute:Na+ symporter
VLGLGFVLSFGYWCTDFLVIQRALASRDLRAAQQTPLIAAVPKMFFPFIVILPGVLAYVLIPGLGQSTDPQHTYNNALPLLMAKYYPAGMLGLGLTALLASFMSGMAGNVTAFNTVWTYDLYQAYMAPGRSDKHYYLAGKVTTVAGILLSICAAYFASMYNNAMDIIQLVFGFVNAPLFATFLLGMFWKRTTGTGAFIGLFGGIASSALFHSVTIAHGNLPGVKGGYVHVLQEYPSEMAQNFYLAAFAFSVCFVLTLVISLLTPSRKTDAELKGLVYSLTPKIVDTNMPFYQRPAVVGIALLIVCVILNFIFW